MERRLRQKVSKSYRKSSEKVRKKFPKSTSAVSHGKKVPRQYQKKYEFSIKTEELLTRKLCPGVSPALSLALSLAVYLQHLWHYQFSIPTLSPKLPMMIFKHTKSYPRMV